MDTTAEVPEFKIARVGKDRKRRGGGVPLFGGGGKGAGLFSGATGGSGAGAAAGMAGLLGKVAVLGLVGALSAGAWQVGRSLRPEEAGAGAKPKLFADANQKYSDEDLANVLRSNNGMMSNSLGYVSGSLDGMTPEERARKEAEAAEAARLAEEEARKAEEEAAKAQPADVAGSPAGIDPAALLKGQQGAGKDEKSGPFSKKFGALSSSFGGGGLAGGSGLAGGVGRGFSNADLNNKGSGGKASAMRSAAVRTTTSKARPARNTGSRGLASRQLNNANALSRQAAGASRPENSAQAADAAFGANNGAGNVISGPGVGTGSGGGVGDSGGSVNPGTGGPTNPGSDPYEQPATQSGRNVTKWQGLVDAAKALMLLIAVLGIIAAVFRDAIITAGLAAIIQYAICALGAIVALLGIAIIAMGEPVQGGILTAVGATIAVIAWTTPEFLGGGAEPVAQVGAAALVASVVGLLGTSVFGNKGGTAAMQ